eukprot:jgi/Bigna1/66529/fgenesh1_pg.1_\
MSHTNLNSNDLYRAARDKENSKSRRIVLSKVERLLTPSSLDLLKSIGFREERVLVLPKGGIYDQNVNGLLKTLTGSSPQGNPVNDDDGDAEVRTHDRRIVLAAVSASSAASDMNRCQSRSSNRRNKTKGSSSHPEKIDLESSSSHNQNSTKWPCIACTFLNSISVVAVEVLDDAVVNESEGPLSLLYIQVNRCEMCCTARQGNGDNDDDMKQAASGENDERKDRQMDVIDLTDLPVLPTPSMHSQLRERVRRLRQHRGEEELQQQKQRRRRRHDDCGGVSLRQRRIARKRKHGKKWIPRDIHGVFLPPIRSEHLLSFVTLAKHLCADAVREQDKAERIFKWIAVNIRYDMETYTGRRRKGKRRSQQAAAVFQSRLAMCTVAGVESRKIGGWARGARKDAHAWSTVRLEGTWYLVDVTWASGHVTDSGRFVHCLSMEYWCAKPEELIRTHFPSAKKWQLLPNPISRAEWERMK